MDWAGRGSIQRSHTQPDSLLTFCLPYNLKLNLSDRRGISRCKLAERLQEPDLPGVCMRIVKSLVPALLLATFFSNLSFAASQDRIAGAIDPTNKVVLKGHVSPMARSQFDEGRVESSRTMRVTMLFMPSAHQQAALDKLIAQQQDETSPNYHQWITAEQFGQRFG